MNTDITLYTHCQLCNITPRITDVYGAQRSKLSVFMRCCYDIYIFQENYLYSINKQSLLTIYK